MTSYTDYAVPSAYDRRVLSEIDWWALGAIGGAFQRCVNITTYAHVLPRPDDLVPFLHVDNIRDIAAIGPHCKTIFNIVVAEALSIAEVVNGAPGVLLRRADDETHEQIAQATAQFAAIAWRARQLEGACLRSIVYEPSSPTPLFDRAIRPIVATANLELSAFLKRYVAYVASIPERLMRRTKELREGTCTDGLSLIFKPIIDPDGRITASLGLLDNERAALEEALEDGGPSTRTAGKVYALINASMPGLVKIGKTRRSAEQRASELESTGVPTPFVVIYELDVPDCDTAERMLHDALAPYRVSDRREFFAIDPKRAVEVMVALRECESTGP